mgnify:CR=1 FL=1
MPDVAIVRCDNYQKEVCERALAEVLAPFGGLDWVKPGMKIAIKANLVAAMKPETAATTHPALLAALTRALVARGAEVVVGDSPGNLFNAPVLNHVYSVTGLHAVEEAGGVLNHDFGMKEVTFEQAYVAKHFSYTSWLDGADAIISFCKLKSHGMMCLSAATKNLFGAVPGTMKPEYHFRYPDPLDFAGMIIDLNSYFKPVLYLVDAVLAMEGNGPTAGSPRQMGALLAGKDCHRLDLICAKLIGLEPMAVPTLQAAANYGLIPESAEEVCVQGDVQSFILPDFDRIERGKGMQFDTVLPGVLGKAFGKIAKKAMRSSPKLHKSECIGCGLCANVCPAKAITIKEKKARVDYQKCIRCFCCQEFCPKGAMKVHRPLPARILHRS